MRRHRSLWRGHCLVAAVVLALGIPAAAAEGPQPVSPGGRTRASYAEARCPTFLWAGVPRATGYEVAVFRVGDAGEEPVLVTRASVAGDARGFTLSDCLERGGRYAWSVAAAGTELRWSQPFLFEIERAPSLEEVEEAIAVLERHRAERLGGEVAPATAPATAGAPRQLIGQPPAGTGVAAVEAAGAAHPGVLRVASAAVPTMGIPSLRVSANVALDDDSNLFKDEVVFLWDDTAGNTALGRRALSSATGTASNNTAVGRYALRNTVQSVGSDQLGSYNTAVGDQAMRTNTVGFANTATGFQALYKNLGGSRNVASGYRALYSNTSGAGNVAIGNAAMRSNTTGTANTASGFEALENNTSGARNTASGYFALTANTTGFANTAIGDEALYSNTTGDANVASGYRALLDNSTGSRNIAIGVRALMNTTGNNNVATGYQALYANTSGVENTAVGYQALDSSTGNRNTAIGRLAGADATTGDDNIFVGSGALGLSGDTNTIRIGGTTSATPGAGQQSRTFIAGIRGITTFSGDTVPVLIDAIGQLGTTSSSRAVKQDVHDVGPLAEHLLELRPVVFRYKQHVANDPDTPLEFGLIAEEVAEIFPELVVYARDGKPETVKYHLLSSLLLELLQRQQVQIDQLEARLGGSEGNEGTQRRTSTGDSSR